MSRTQFFLIAMACSFGYYIFPGYFFAMLSSLSWICWLSPNSVFLHQLGSGMHGLGVAAVGLDWSTVSSFLGSPLTSPWFASANIAVAFTLFMYLMMPLSYWNNLFHAKNFPIYSRNLFHGNGSIYDTAAIINSHFNLDKAAYDRSGRLYLSTFFALTYGVGFATLSATLVHVFLFNGKDIWRQTKTAFIVNSGGDIHNRLMKKYEQVPMWWFLVILVPSIALVLFACEYYKEALQLPWWGVLFACAIAFVFTLPIDVITATTNQVTDINIILLYLMSLESLVIVDSH